MQILHPDRLFGKTPDGNDRAVQGYRRQDDIDAVSVCQPCIHDRRGFIDYPVAGRYDLLDNVLKLLPGYKSPVCPGDLPCAFYENTVGPVDHDLCDRRVLDQLLEDVQPADRIEELLPHSLHVLEGQILLPFCPHDLLIDQAQYFTVLDTPGKIDSSENGIMDPVSDLCIAVSHRLTTCFYYYFYYCFYYRFYYYADRIPFFSGCREHCQSKTITRFPFSGRRETLSE